MFDAKELLGRLTQTGLSDTTMQRVKNALGAGSSSGNNAFSDLVGNLFGKTGKTGGGLSNVTGTAEELFNSAKRSVQSGSPLAIGGLAALAGAVLGGGGGAVRGAVGGGMLALLGGLAWSVLKQGEATASKPAELPGQDAPLGLREPSTPAEEAALRKHAELAIRAMIAAAKADGEIDANEKARILGKLGELGESKEGEGFIAAEIAKPLSIDEIAKDVTSPEVAVQVYAASLLAIDVDTAAERKYLASLAKAIRLDSSAVARIHEMLGIPA
jgi:uncharacterized membrane protein YebE (DUF533 family)